MEILIIGVDGLGDESLNAFNLKRLKKRIENSKRFTPNFDNVVSRGWAEMYSGKNAYHTGAFFQTPVINNGKITISQKTGQSCVSSHVGQENLLWNKLNAEGYKVGIFCVPTVTSKEVIDGFFVTATGAGNIKAGLTKENYSPDDLFDTLSLPDLDLGLRMGYGAFIPNNLEEFEQKVNKHIADYFYLLNILKENNKVDILFAGTRVLTEFTYKFIQLMKKEAKSEHEVKLKKVLYKLADNLDIMLDKFIEDINPKHLFIISDHGISPLNYNVNFNELLYQCEYIKSKNSLKSTIKSYIDPIRRKLKNKKIGDSYPTYNLETSEAFSVGFTDLIYINDERFTGKQMSQEEAFIKSKEIASKLSKYTKQHNLEQFIEFEALNLPKYIDDQGKIASPNIRVHMQEGCANRFRTHNTIVEKNICSFEQELFNKGFFGEYSGSKSTDVVITYSGSSNSVKEIDSLTDVYDVIINLAKDLKN